MSDLNGKSEKALFSGGIMKLFVASVHHKHQETEGPRNLTFLPDRQDLSHFFALRIVHVPAEQAILFWYYRIIGKTPAIVAEAP
jgi:hypothetical protein